MVAVSFERVVLRAKNQRLAKLARRAAQKIRFPKDFKGAVMWCPECYRELGRIPDGEEMPAAEQQAIADAHRAVCMRRKLKVA